MVEKQNWEKKKEEKKRQKEEEEEEDRIKEIIEKISKTWEEDMDPRISGW